MSEVGGIRTRWLFADDLEKGKEYLVEVAGSGVHMGRTGTEVPYVILLGPITGGESIEWQLCEWRIQSKEKFNPKEGQKFKISQLGTDVFFKPWQESQ
jgi:hypothetical protein